MPTTLNDYQKRVLDKLYDADTNPHGVIAYHGLGAGKTYTAQRRSAGIGRQRHKGLVGGSGFSWELLKNKFCFFYLGLG